MKRVLFCSISILLLLTLVLSSCKETKYVNQTILSTVTVAEKTVTQTVTQTIAGTYEAETTDISTNIVQTTTSVSQSMEEYMFGCGVYTYDEISRNPDLYKGLKALFKAEVVQAQENGLEVVLRVNITEGDYYWADTIWVNYTKKSITESRILEGDIINLYGTLQGLISYTAVLGNIITIPLFEAEYITPASIKTQNTTTSSRKIVVNSSATTMTQLGSGSWPDTPSNGYIFLVITLTIQNQGYDSISVGQYYFSLVINNIKYDYEFSSYLENSLNQVNVLNGGTIQGQILYEIPISVVGLDYQLTYGGYGTYNFEWIKQ